jgi:hypothetical protein
MPARPAVRGRAGDHGQEQDPHRHLGGRAGGHPPRCLLRIRLHRQAHQRLLPRHGDSLSSRAGLLRHRPVRHQHGGAADRHDRTQRARGKPMSTRGLPGHDGPAASSASCRNRSAFGPTPCSFLNSEVGMCEPRFLICGWRRLYAVGATPGRPRRETSRPGTMRTLRVNGKLSACSDSPERTNSSLCGSRGNIQIRI